MRKRIQISLLLSLFLFTMGQAQVSKTIQVTTPGTMLTLLTSSELASVTNLTVTGSMNAADFVILRDSMPILSVLDLSSTSIEAFTGAGTNGIGTYLANEIPANAFYNNKTYISKTSLTSVISPGSVTTIGPNSFEGCKNIISMILPPKTSQIGDYAFTGCKGLTVLTIPDAVASIGEDAFDGCSGLSGTLIIPPLVTSIGSAAFSFCTGLSSVVIPVSVDTIGESAFVSCSGSISVESNNANYSSVDGVLFDKAQTRLISFPLSKGGSYSIPSTVTTIGDHAFMYNTLLTSVTIPPSVLTIGKYAFCKSRGLTSITIPPSVTSIGNFGFASNSKLISVTIPSSVTTIGSSVFFACTGLKTITIPSSVNSIGSHAFSGCTGLTSFYINAATPVDLSSSYFVFYNVSKTNCTLYVPFGSLRLYQAANQWQDFTNVIDNITAVASTIEQRIKISFNRQTDVIHVDGIHGKYLLYVFDMNGRPVFSKSGLTLEDVILASLPSGIYIVKLQVSDAIIERKIVKE